MDRLNLNTLFGKSDLSGVICLESATRINNLSTFPDLPLMLFQKTTKTRDLGYLQIYATDSLDLEFTIQAGMNLYVTTPERTIIDLIRFDRDLRFIFESIEKFRRSNRDDKLLKVARHYNCSDLLGRYLVEYNDWIRDQYNYE